MLGVHRPSVTVAAGDLQRRGTISYHRGHVRVTDRRALERASCECYGVIRAEFGASWLLVTHPGGCPAVPSPPMPRPADEPPLIHARGLTKRFGTFTAVDGIDFDVAPGEAFGFLGPERRRQDDRDADDRLRLAAVGRRAARARPRSASTDGPRDPGAHRRRAAAGHARHRADGPREPRDLRPLLRPAAARGRPAGRRAARRSSS